VTTAILLPIFIGFLSKRLEKSGGIAKYNERPTT
jgi:2-keto-3-deoxygluconate permease